MIQVVFNGDKFKAVIEEFGKEIVECHPVIYREESIIGLKIEAATTKRFLLLRENDCDLFKLYRTMRIVSHSSIVNANILALAFLAADRDKSISSSGFSPPLDGAIKRRELSEIMMEFVPEEIIREAIKAGINLSEREKWFIEQEILAETIICNEAIAKLGIKKPEEIVESLKEKEKDIAAIYGRINTILESYFDYAFVGEELRPTIANMAVNVLSDKNFDFSDEVVVAFSGHLAQLNYYNLMRNPNEEGPFTENLFQNIENESMTNSIDWLSSEKDYLPNDAARELDAISKCFLEPK